MYKFLINTYFHEPLRNKINYLIPSQHSNHLHFLLHGSNNLNYKLAASFQINSHSHRVLWQPSRQLMISHCFYCSICLHNKCTLLRQLEAEEIPQTNWLTTFYFVLSGKRGFINLKMAITKKFTLMM